MDGMAGVKLDNLGKTYPGGVRAVDGLDLTVADGEFLVLVGPSGSGKSTTLRMIAGLEQPSDGTIRIGDRVVTYASPRERDVAMVFQNYAMYPNKTVRGNMAFGLSCRGVAKAEIARRVAWAAELLGLQGLLDRKPHALSGGQRQRVALARALVRRPKVFLFDEPLSNLDAKLRADTRAELKRLHRQLNVTTIYVTHDQEEAMTLGDRIAVLRGGRLQQCGRPLDVYHSPVNRFVAGFIGTPSMNFIEGRLCEDAAGQLWFESPSMRMPIDGRQVREVSVKGDSPIFVDHGFAAVPAKIGTVPENVVLGIRPENLRLQPYEAGHCGAGHSDRSEESRSAAEILRCDQNDREARLSQSPWSISGTVEVIEPLGSVMDLHVRVAGGQRLVCRVPAEAIQCESQVTLHVDASATHLFAANDADR
jgi:multiple sugar transport system ATP-binding protein